jgi:NAD(P)-dependent dehydrogenase (short-subunit alcohol dehydrogenase family)
VNIAGKSVVVTGGASGIGRALAERFAAEGARGVTVADINGEWAQKTAERIGEQGIGVGCDVSDPDAISRLVSAVIEAMAAERFLILPHPKVGASFLRKATDYDAWLSRTRDRLQGFR